MQIFLPRENLLRQVCAWIFTWKRFHSDLNGNQACARFQTTLLLLNYKKQNSEASIHCSTLVSPIESRARALIPTISAPISAFIVWINIIIAILLAFNWRIDHMQNQLLCWWQTEHLQFLLLLLLLLFLYFVKTSNSFLFFFLFISNRMFLNDPLNFDQVNLINCLLSGGF